MWNVTYRDNWTNAAGKEFTVAHVECDSGEYIGTVIIVEREANGEDISHEEIVAEANTQGVPMRAGDIDG